MAARARHFPLAAAAQVTYPSQVPAAPIEVTSIGDAERALAYFNGFHDGFIQRLVVTSLDAIDPDLSQTCTGLFQVDLELAHYNSAADGRPLQPHTRRVYARFEGVREPRFEFAEEYLGNTIIALDVVPVTRRPMSMPRDEACLALELTRIFLVEAERRWETRRLRLFTFERATFREGDA
jgi:hypothetical protein